MVTVLETPVMMALTLIKTVFLTQLTTVPTSPMLISLTLMLTGLETSVMTTKTMMGSATQLITVQLSTIPVKPTPTTTMLAMRARMTAMETALMI